MSQESFTCGTCGQEHAALPTDYAFGLPDEIYALSYLDRYRRSRSNSDFCTLDEERYFIRGVMPVPFQDAHGEFMWGLWVEVERNQHDLYLAGYHDDLSGNSRFLAKLSNRISGYDTTLGAVVEVQFGSGNDRPAFYFLDENPHELAREQRNGITRERHHQILEALAD